MHQDIVVVLAAVLAGGVLAQWLGWRLHIPAIVFLLAGGLVAGPITGALDADEVFGDLLFPGVSVAVAVILFEGALGLGVRSVRAAGRTVLLLLTVGAAITLVLTALAARLVLDVDWDLAALLAAVLVVTGPTVVGPIVRSIGLRSRVTAILESEGTLIDPIGAILTVLTFQALFDADRSAGSVTGQLVLTLVAGSAIGLVGAGLLVVLLSRYLVPDQLHNATTLAVVVGAFAASNEVVEESGLLAVTVMGIAFASQSRVPVRHVLAFNETLRILFISGLFVLLGSRIEADTLREIEWRNFVFLAVLVLLVRPLSVLASTVGAALSGRERLFLAATAPRGIVAAAVASVFSLHLGEIGVDNGQILVSATFTVIFGTVLLSGLLGPVLARRLDLVVRRDAVLLLGANRFARALAASLEAQGATVRLIDLDQRELARARMTGLWAHRGSVVTDTTWEAAGIESASCFAALTQSDEINTLATGHAAGILGRKHTYQLAPHRPEHDDQVPVGVFARPLFDGSSTLDSLVEKLDQGWEPVTWTCGDGGGPSPEDGAIRLYVIDGKGNVELHSPDGARRPRPGDTVVDLRPPSPQVGADAASGAAAD